MNKSSTEKRAQIIAALVEGNSIRATCRMAGVAKNTVVKLLADVGAACSEYQHKALRNLTCKRIQCDEIWSFCYAKQKSVPADKQGRFGFGDVWTWTALDPDTKLIVSYLVGLRNAEWAKTFMADVASRLASRVQITTDGNKVYLEAVEAAFGADVDYAMLVKLYGAEQGREARYSPPKCIGCRRKRVSGKPEKKAVSTSMIERQNLTMLMSMRRFTRLTNAFSKKIENLEHAVALHFMHYNFCRIRQTLRVTPAMEAKVTNRVWSIADIVALLEKNEDQKDSN
jgi:IS1 family transposase/lambda repressor-like predicted transcriptional regulator